MFTRVQVELLTALSLTALTLWLAFFMAAFNVWFADGANAVLAVGLGIVWLTVPSSAVNRKDSL